MRPQDWFMVGDRVRVHPERAGEYQDIVGRQWTVLVIYPNNGLVDINAESLINPNKNYRQLFAYRLELVTDEGETLMATPVFTDV